MSLDSRRTGVRFPFPSAVVVVVALLALQACVSATAGIATSNVPLEGKRYTVVGTGSTTESWVGIDLGIVGFPLGPPPVDRAVRRLLDDKKGDALINLRYGTDKIIVLFLLTIHRFHLTADVVRLETEAKLEPGSKKR